MKIAFLYLLSIFLLMVGKYAYANDTAQHGDDAHLKIRHIGKMQTFKFASIHQDPTVFTNSTPTGDPETILRVETEDEDIVFRRKLVLLFNYFILVAGSSFLIYFLSCFTRRLYTYRPIFIVTSSKYILQSVLRI